MRYAIAALLMVGCSSGVAAGAPTGVDASPGPATTQDAGRLEPDSGRSGLDSAAEDAAPLPTVGHECVPREGGAPSECPYPTWTCVGRAELADGGDAGAFCTFPCDPSHGGTTQCEVEHFGHCESFADASPVCAVP